MTPDAYSDDSVATGRGGRPETHARSREEPRVALALEGLGAAAVVAANFDGPRRCLRNLPFDHTAIMSSERPVRALRQRKSVNYNLKDMANGGSNTPGWLKSTSVHHDAPKQNRKPRKRKSAPVAKENKLPADEANATPVAKEAAKTLLTVAPTMPKNYRTKDEGKENRAAKPPAKRKKREAKPIAVAAEDKPAKKRRGRPPKKAAKEAETLRPSFQTPPAAQDEPSMSISEEHTLSDADATQAEERVQRRRPSRPSKATKIRVTKDLDGVYDLSGGRHAKAREASPKPHLTSALLDQLGGACAPSLHQSSESSLFRDLLDQYNEMKTKYHELKSSRMSHVQAMLEEQSKNILKQQDAGNKLIRHWKEEAYKQADMVNMAVEESVKDVHDKIVYLTSRKGQLEHQTTCLAGEVAQLKEENARLKEEKSSPSGNIPGGLQGLVPLLTGLEVLLHPNKRETYRISHARTGFSFELDCANLEGTASSVAASDASDIGYTPVSFGTLDAKLPEYLKEEIYFDKSQVPILLNKVLSTVNS